MSDTNNPRGVIGIDEPENGLRPSKMGLLAQLLETQATDNQQLIVTTHSPYLLDHIPLRIYLCLSKRKWQNTCASCHRFVCIILFE